MLQAEVAREQFCLVIEHMCEAGWLEEKVDASIFDEKEEVAFHTAAKLLSVYHHATRPHTPAVKPPVRFRRKCG